MSDMQYQGRFVWHDLMSADMEQSKAFFQQLFGWNTEDADMGPGGAYTMFKVGDAPAFGGITPLDAARGATSHWLSYISTDDVDDFCARATDLGATVTGQPMDIPDVGRFAVLADPQGAAFAAFSETERSPIEEPQGMQPPGSVVWNGLMTADVEAAKAFYGRMFGWTSEGVDVGTGPHTILRNGDAMVGGMMKRPDDTQESGWTIYFNVDDIDQTVKRVEELGGRTLFPVMDIPQTGRVTWATDPAGATFGIMEPEAMPQ